MGYIEDLAARDAARQNMEAAKKAEAAKILNQDGLAVQSVVNTPYAGGMTAEDSYKLQLIKDAQKANDQRAFEQRAVDNYNSSKQYVEDGRTLARQHWDTPAAYEAAVRSDKFDSRVDPGLAAKWMADRDSFK